MMLQVKKKNHFLFFIGGRKMGRLKLITMAGFLVLGLQIPSVSQESQTAKEYYVSIVDGDDANNGLTPETAFKTIQRGVDVADLGDTVYILQGVYHENVVIENKTSITIKAIGKVSIEYHPDMGTGKIGMKIKGGSRITVDGITFRGWVTYGSICLEIGGSSYPTIINCNFSSSWGVLMRLSGGTVCNCTFSGIKALSIGQGLIPAIVKNCTFAWNSCYNADRGGVSIGVSKFRNNIVAFNPLVTILGWVDSNYNDYWANKKIHELKMGPNDKEVDPQFIPGTFYLKPTSPLINAGEFQEGQFPNIGARGVGAVASETHKTSFPPFSDFRNWAEAGGAKPGEPASNFELDDKGRLRLKEGISEASIFSPVFDTGVKDAIFKSLSFEALEDIYKPQGERKVIDEVKQTLIREVQYRVSNTKFDQLDPAPDFQTTTNQRRNLNVTGQYIQVKLTFRKNGR
jgi:hypothetical protein